MTGFNPNKINPGSNIEKKVKKSIELSGIGTIEYVESHIEFPAYLIEETGGVKGYVRKQFDSVENIKEKIKDVLFKNTYSQDNYIHRDAVSSKIEELYNLVTNNEFPEKTSINVLGGAWDQKNAKKTDHFKEDKLMLQKIFGGQRIGYKQNDTEIVMLDNQGNLKEKVTYDPLGNIPTVVRKMLTERPAKRNFEVGISPDEKESLQRYDLDLKYFDKLVEQVTNPKDDTALIMLGRSGLHITNRNKNGDDGLYFNTATHGEEVFAGFSLKNKAFKEYLEKTKILIENLPTDEINKVIDSSLLQTIKVSLDSIDYFLQDKDEIRFGARMDHPAIPIVQGYQTIPDLRWCHASYMSIPTKNGLNILEFVT